MKKLKIIVYIIACVLAMINLFYLGGQPPYQLLFFTMVANVLAAVLAWQAYLTKEEFTQQKGNLTFQVFCWTACAFIWTFKFIIIIL